MPKHPLATSNLNMKNGWETETHQKQTWQLFLRNGVFWVIFHVVSLLIFDSIFQKNEMRHEMKNESRTVTLNDTIIVNLALTFFVYNCWQIFGMQVEVIIDMQDK